MSEDETKITHLNQDNIKPSVEKINPAMLVQTYKLPTKVEFAEDKSKTKPKHEGD